MRFQVLLVGLATLICVAVGGTRLRVLIGAQRAFASAERAGRWNLLVADHASLRAVSYWGGTSAVTGFTSFQPNQVWDLTPELRRVAGMETYGYSSPGVPIQVWRARRNDAIAVATPPTISTVQCPLFDESGNLLFIEATGPGGKLRRLHVPKNDSAAKSTRTSDVRTATPLRFDDCFERSEDGESLAWLGSDLQIHVARRTGNNGDYLSDHRTFSGQEFALSADGATIAVRDGTRIAIVNLTAGTTRDLAWEAAYAGIVDFSPDGTWIAVATSGSFGDRGFRAVRLSDAVSVAMAAVPSYYYYAQPGQVPARWRTAP